jgi:hypothetical protein
MEALPEEVAFALAPVQTPDETSPQFVILSGDGRITSLCQSIDGADDIDLIGAHFEIMFACDSRHGRLPAALLERARRTGSAAIIGRFLRTDGTPYAASCTLVTLRGEEGRSRGFVMAIHPLDVDIALEAAAEPGVFTGLFDRALFLLFGDRRPARDALRR